MIPYTVLVSLARRTTQSLISVWPKIWKYHKQSAVVFIEYSKWLLYSKKADWFEFIWSNKENWVNYLLIAISKYMKLNNSYALCICTHLIICFKQLRLARWILLLWRKVMMNKYMCANADMHAFFGFVLALKQKWEEKIKHFLVWEVILYYVY